ncbi:MAG: hypothetical protein J6S67_15675 [Methanobrevibacter sp.]|nr:hypothetical protein [Methanobrevibacter sp.]
MMEYSNRALSSTQNEEYGSEMFYSMGREIVRNEIARDNEPSETAIEIMSNLSGILTEIKSQVDLIDSAIYGKRVEDATTAEEKPPTPPMLMILRQQRDFAEDILKSIVHIREGLWR